MKERFGARDPAQNEKPIRSGGGLRMILQTACHGDLIVRSNPAMKTSVLSARHRRTNIGISLLVCLGLACSGCTSTRFHSAAQGAVLTAEVQVGDRVDCRMQDGSQKGFTVTAVESGTLVGESVRVPVAEVVSVEVTRFDGKKTMVETGKFVGGVVLASGLLALCLVAHGFPITSFR